MVLKEIFHNIVFEYSRIVIIINLGNQNKKH